MSTEEKIVKLLRSTKRNGIEPLIEYLDNESFFKAPVSTRFHGAHSGGLADHSLRVYELLLKHTINLTLDEAIGSGQRPLKITTDSNIIAALLHDVCKIGAYIRTKADDGWTNNRNKPKGHARLSIERIKKHIELTELEELMIKYHMGVFGLNEYDEKSGEYPLRGDDTKGKEERYSKSLANAWYHNPIVKVMYFCDELATLEEKAK